MAAGQVRALAIEDVLLNLFERAGDIATGANRLVRQGIDWRLANELERVFVLAHPGRALPSAQKGNRAKRGLQLQGERSKLWACAGLSDWKDDPHG
ncbi:hypothetical protein HRbin30_00397 [bacterium HR30]|nr:hypothetical protein HRbin30_00397 [bacterium HR30]